MEVPSVQQETAAYENVLRTKLKDSAAAILGIPDTSHDVLVQKPPD
jgi:hypothetical protein